MVCVTERGASPFPAGFHLDSLTIARAAVAAARGTKFRLAAGENSLTFTR